MKKAIFNFLMKHLFKTIVDHDVVSWRDLTDDMKKIYIKDAKILSQNESLMRMMQNMKYRATKQMFEKSKNYEDMYFGKATLYIIDLLESKIKNLASKDNK